MDRIKHPGSVYRTMQVRVLDWDRTTAYRQQQSTGRWSSVTLIPSSLEFIQSKSMLSPFIRSSINDAFFKDMMNIHKQMSDMLRTFSPIGFPSMFDHRHHFDAGATSKSVNDKSTTHHSNNNPSITSGNSDEKSSQAAQHALMSFPGTLTSISSLFDTPNSWRPTCDVTERDNKIVFTAELPGCSIDDVTIDLLDNDRVLRISGKREHQNSNKPASNDDSQSNKSEQWHISERFYGSFTRQFRLPESVTPDKISARFDNGVLSVEVEKPTECNSRQNGTRIPITNISSSKL